MRGSINSRGLARIIGLSGMTISRLEKSSFLEVPVPELTARLSDFEADIERDGTVAILDNKNACHTALNSERADPKTAARVYGRLLDLFRQHISFVREALEARELDLTEKDRQRRTIKTFCALLTSVATSRHLIPETQVLPKKGRRKVTETEGAIPQIWLVYTERFIDNLIDLFSFQFHELWSPPIVEEDFLRIIVTYIFKIFENGQISKLKHIIHASSKLLGLILTKHSALLVVTLKVLNIVQHVDNQVNNMCYVVQTIVNDYSYPHIIVQLFKEISQLNNETVSDSSSAKNIALFISQLGSVLPREVLSNSSLLMCHLEFDPYNMRNAVLESFSQVLIKLLSKSDMDENLKRTRDSFLDKMQEHFHDVNAFVRSRILTIFADIVKNRALPLARYNKITDLAIRRLNDKSCYVRKNATALLYQLIVCNPYSQFLNIKEIENQIESKKTTESNLITTANNVISDADSAWEAIESAIIILFSKNSENEKNSQIINNSQSFNNSQILNLTLNSQQENENNEQLNIDPDVLSLEFKQKIIKHLLNREYEYAIDILAEFLETARSEIYLSYTSEAVLKIFKILFFEHISLKIIKGEIEQAETNDENDEINRAAGNYLKNALHFAKNLKSSMCVVFRLLQSETISDIVEVVQFLTTAYKFGICGLYEILDNILPLIWSSEANLKTAMVEASMNILTYSPQGFYGQNSSAPVQEKEVLINNLFTILKDCSLGFTKAIEELLAHVSEKNLLPANFTRSLWIKHSAEDSSDFQKRQAVKVLGMLVRGSPIIFDQNLEILSSVGFSKESSIILAINTAYAIINYSNSRRKSESLTRLENNHILFKKIKGYIVGKFQSLKSPLWSVLCEHSIKIFISLSNNPLLLINDLLKDLFSLLNFVNSDIENKSSVNYVYLGRILHAVSHSSVGILLLLEGDFLNEIKRRAAIVQKSTNKGKNKSRGKSLSTNVLEETGDDAFPIGATADETEADFVKELCENEILHQENIFAKFIPIILHIIDKNSNYPPDLVSAAALALSKLMLLSSEFCSKHLQLMFTLLKKSEIEVVRSNTVILIGDIIQRFPNLVEPWMFSVFACLRDKAPNFRRVVLAVLSSLILNDMVKIKGHISELAICIEDEDPVISTRTRLFFTELSRKDNAIYNILPDIISRLSDSRESLDRALFEKVMKFLLKFLQKEKHCESLVDKLCNRMALSHNITEQLDIVYCFLQLNLNEKAFKKLIEHFPSYKDKVYDDQLFESFINVIAKFKKTAREEAKNMADEFEKRLSQAHTRGINDENVNLSSKAEEDLPPERPPSPTIPEVFKSPKRPTKSKREAVVKKASPVVRKRTRAGKKVLATIDEDTESDNPPKKK